MKDKRKMIIIGASAAILLVILLTFLFKDNKLSSEKALKKIGKIFYEDYYYVNQESNSPDIKEYLSKFKSTGIKVDLDNLSKCNKIDSKYLDIMDENECDIKNTYIRIYPKEPYSKKDYKLEINLDCKN